MLSTPDIYTQTSLRHQEHLKINDLPLAIATLSKDLYCQISHIAWSGRKSRYSHETNNIREKAGAWQSVSYVLIANNMMPDCRQISWVYKILWFNDIFLIISLIIFMNDI